ncbi:hypothetical protein HY798_00850 [Candidatus Falkowbacteria bacterium]|nr:hypothetical protein [Candidatus Falkowbacteria bacterium]
MEKRFLSLILAIIILTIAGLSFYYFFGPGKKQIVYQKAVAGLSNKEAILILNDGRQERWFKGEISRGTTVADVLQAASLAGKFECQIDSQIVSLDGLSGNGRTSWHCYLNSKEVGDQISKEMVYSGDKIVCLYQ